MEYNQKTQKLSYILGYVRDLPHRNIFHIAWPMILSNISTPLMTLADSAMLGHSETPVYLGAVAIGGNLLMLMLWAFSFLRMSTTSIVGQALGANDNRARIRHLIQTSGLAIGLGLLLILLQWVLVPFAASLMTPDPEISRLAQQYCHIRIFGAPATFMLYVLFGWFIAHQNTRIPLVIIVCSNLLNAALDYIFIVKLELGSQGAGFASLIAELCACIAAIVALCPQIKVLREYCRSFDLQLGNGWGHLFKINSDLMIRTALLLLVFNFFTAQGANLGITALATNALIMQLAVTVSYTLDGYAHAAEATVAHAVGARDTHQFFEACAAATLAATVVALMLSLGFAVFGKQLVALLTDQDSIRKNAAHYLVWLQVAPIVSVWCYLLDGIFTGAAQTRAMRNYMIAAVLVVFLPTWWFLRPLGNHGLWAAFTLFNLFRGLSLAFAFYTESKNQTWIK